MRLLALIAAGLFAGSLLAADDKKDEKKPKDEEAILGTWQAVKYDDGTADKPREKAQIETRMTFAEGEKLLMRRGTQEYKGEFKLDPTAKPKSLDMTGELGTTLAAYSLEGDTLTLAICVDGRVDRPDALKADGKGIAVMTLKRVRDEKKSKDAEAIIGTWKVEKFDTGGLNVSSAGVLSKTQLTFSEGGKMLWAYPELDFKAEYQFDPDAKLKTLDMSTEHGTVGAIYELDRDTLRIAFTIKGQAERPTELKADGKSTGVMTLKRVRAGKKEDKKDK